MKPLSAADPKDKEADDLKAWVAKSRALEEKRREEERIKAERTARMLAAQVRVLELTEYDGKLPLISALRPDHVVCKAETKAFRLFD